MKALPISPALMDWVLPVTEQIHDLYRKEGKRMEAAYHAREKARAEHNGYLRANPPKPGDVTISFWKKFKRPIVVSKKNPGKQNR